MKRSHGWLLAIVGLLALVSAGYLVTRPDEAVADEGAARPFVVPVKLTTLERGDLAPAATLSGTVRAARRARLGFDTSGLVTEIAVAEAQRVDAGTVLARLESGDEQYELAAARASLELARRQHELLAAGEREEERRRLEAVLAAAVAEAELARLEVERGQKLLADRIVSQAEQDARRAAFDAADKRRLAAEEEYAAAQAGARVEDLAVAAARVEEAQARVDAVQHELSKAELKAPWPGSVVRRYLSTGDHVSAGDPVFELVDLANLEVHLEIPGRFAPRVGDDSRVRLRLPGSGEVLLERTLDATIAAADEASRSFRGILRLAAGDDLGGRLRPGMFVEVELGLRVVRDALVVAEDAVLADERGSYVVRARTPPDAERPGPVAELVPVLVLARAEGLAALESLGPPLAPGDELVLVGGDNAFPGAALLPVGAAGPNAAAPTGGAGGASE